MRGSRSPTFGWPIVASTFPVASTDSISSGAAGACGRNSSVPSRDTLGSALCAEMRNGSPVVSSVDNENGTAQIPALLVVRSYTMWPVPAYIGARSVSFSTWRMTLFASPVKIEIVSTTPDPRSSAHTTARGHRAGN